MADGARVVETLPVEDRAGVAHELLRSLEPDERSVTADRTDEIRRRIDEVEAGTAEVAGRVRYRRVRLGAGRRSRPAPPSECARGTRPWPAHTRSCVSAA